MSTQTEEQKLLNLKKDIKSIGAEIKEDLMFSIQLLFYGFVCSFILYFCYLQFLSKDRQSFMQNLLDSLQISYIIPLGILFLSIIFQLMSVVTGTSFVYKGTVLSNPQDIYNTKSKLELYLLYFKKKREYQRLKNHKG